MINEDQEMCDLVKNLTVRQHREETLHELSSKRDKYPELALILWHSFGTVMTLLLEVIAIYPHLQPASLTASASNHVCNALALFQVIATHSETKHHFLQAQIPLYLFPFLNTVTKTRPFEYLRLTSLGVIGGLLKADDPDVVTFLLSTEIIPLCLRIMGTGSELSKTVATFIVQRILMDDKGLEYICETKDRFFAVSSVLADMVASQVEKPDVRLLKHIIRCYSRLADNEMARETLRGRPVLGKPECTTLSSVFTREALMVFNRALQNEVLTKSWLSELVEIMQR